MSDKAIQWRKKKSGEKILRSLIRLKDILCWSQWLMNRLHVHRFVITRVLVLLVVCSRFFCIRSNEWIILNSFHLRLHFRNTYFSGFVCSVQSIHYENSYRPIYILSSAQWAQFSPSHSTHSRQPWIRTSLIGASWMLKITIIPFPIPFSNRIGQKVSISCS